MARAVGLLLRRFIAQYSGDRSEMAEAASPPYELEFYVDDGSHEPVLAFMRSLSPLKRRAIGVALHEFLGHLGPDVVRTDFGKSLGGGLYEFRVDQDAEQILRK